MINKYELNRTSGMKIFNYGQSTISNDLQDEGKNSPNANKRKAYRRLPTRGHASRIKSTMNSSCDSKDGMTMNEQQAFDNMVSKEVNF